MPGKQNNGKGEEYIRVAEGFLEIRQKLQPGRLSSTGRNYVRVSTGGFQEVEGGIRVNLTAISKTAS